MRISASRCCVRHVVVLVSFLLAVGISALCQVSVTTHHYDNFRTGRNTHETILTPLVVRQSTFGKLFSQAVDGQLYAEPLYLRNLIIPNKGVHNTLLVATEHDSVYAFDADNNLGANASPLWQVSFINPVKGATTIPSADAGTKMIYPEIGITGTPLIRTATGTLYVVAATKENGVYFQRLHALNVTTGAEKFGGPVVIRPTGSGTGAGSSNGVITFDALRENQRPPLPLLNGVVYLAWASHGVEE